MSGETTGRPRDWGYTKNRPEAADLARLLAVARVWMRHHSWCDVCDIFKHGDSGEGVCNCGAGPAFSDVDAMCKYFGLDPFEGHTQRVLDWRKQHDAQRDLLRRAREALTKLRRSHMTCEDCWYSCPKSGECCNDGAGDKCDCGADEDNAIIDGLLAALDEETK